MNKEVFGAQIAMHNVSAVNVDDGFDGLAKPFLSEGQRYGEITAIKTMLQAAMTGFGNNPVANSVCHPRHLQPC